MTFNFLNGATAYADQLLKPIINTAAYSIFEFWGTSNLKVLDKTTGAGNSWSFKRMFVCDTLSYINFYNANCQVDMFGPSKTGFTGFVLSTDFNSVITCAGGLGKIMIDRGWNVTDELDENNVAPDPAVAKIHKATGSQVSVTSAGAA